MRDDIRQRLRNTPLAWTTAALVFGILLHVDRVPFWVSTAAFLCIGWRLAGEVRLLPLPSRYAKLAVAFLLIAAILARFKTLNGLSAGTALLVVMGAIKLLETHTRRDRYVTIGATVFLLLAACLDRQTLLRAPLYIVHAWLCCTALATVAQEGGGLTNRAAGVLAARSLAMSVPLALVLFLFFPRVVGGFWVLPQGNAAVTGLSDRMSPGDISALSESDEPAFRVAFQGEPPPPAERYWRGPVLHDFDGATWSGANHNHVRSEVEPIGKIYRYRITLEPTSQPWWFALDTVVERPNRRVMLTADYQLVGFQPVTRNITYDAVSSTQNRFRGPLPVLVRRLDTRLPPDRNPRTIELARQMRASVTSDAEFVAAALALFETGGFQYTLTPPLLERDAVDDFLFNTKQGFCGHYASAFVTLMRAGGVPARVVTGYLGGEWNPIREYFIVRQSDAHAWAEVWLDDRGWTRVDPTAVVAPERLERGVYDLLPNALSAPERFVREVPWINDMRQRWDALNYWWNERVVRFDFSTQLDLLRWLGIPDANWHVLGWFFGTALVAWLAFVAWHVGRALRVPQRDRLARAYNRLCAKLARAGAPREPHLGPHAYAAVVASRRPDLAEAARELLHRYAELRYGVQGADAPGTNDIAAFERDVARLHVRRTS
jgi:transglutaminase-like putative cysteine protease